MILEMEKKNPFVTENTINLLQYQLINKAAVTKGHDCN